MKYGYTERNGSREKWFDSVTEAKNWAENQEFGEWNGRSGLKTREERSKLEEVIRNVVNYL